MNRQAKTEEAALAAARELAQQAESLTEKVRQGPPCELVARTRIHLLDGRAYDIDDNIDYVRNRLKLTFPIESVALRVSADNATSVPINPPSRVLIASTAVSIAIDLVSQ